MAAKGEAVDAGAAAAAALEAARAALPKPVVLTVDMPAEVVARCTELAAEALTTYKVEKDQAMHIKRALELWNGALWHVVVGASFGASVCHEVHAFVLFKIGKVNVLCFQSFDDGAPPIASERASERARARRAAQLGGARRCEAWRARRGAVRVARRRGGPALASARALTSGEGGSESAPLRACGALQAACQLAACLRLCACVCRRTQARHARARPCTCAIGQVPALALVTPLTPLARSLPLPRQQASLEARRRPSSPRRSRRRRRRPRPSSERSRACGARATSFVRQSAICSDSR